MTKQKQNVQLSDLVSLVPFALGVFLMGAGVGIAVKLATRSIAEGHTFDLSNEFFLQRTLLFGSLAYGVNFCFGCAFGFRYVRHQRLVGNMENTSHWLSRLVNPGLALLLIWWLLFNAPVFLADAPRGLPWYLKTRFWLESMYFPIRNDLFLYFYMGNFALLGSFLFAISMGKFWRRIFPSTGGSGPHA
ncbi:MAG: hypothetical protein ACOC2L_02855 [Candidatus Sumerlaeota bacterium]